MCGIVGVISTESSGYAVDNISFFKQALFTDTLRGSDSTGIFLWDEKLKAPEVFKKALAAPDFLQLKRVDKLLSTQKNWNIMVGHNRAATRGGIEHHTAHPFQIGNITLVHNGTLTAQSYLPDGLSFKVDSEAITHAIAVQGAEKTISALEGAFALVWHDNLDGSINIVRNEERPFAFAKVKNEDTILFASEIEMLRWIAIRNKFTIETAVLPKPGEIFTFYPHKDNKKWALNPKVKKVALAPKKLVDYYGNAWPDYNQNYRSGGKGKKVSSPLTKRLADYGLQYGETVYVTNLEFIVNPRSKQKDKGYIHGTIEYADCEHKVVIPAITKKKFEKEYKDNELYGDIVGTGSPTKEEDFVKFYLKDDSIVVVVGEKEKEEISKDLVLGPNKTFITQDEFDELTKHGCCQCGANILLKDAENIGWTFDKAPVCSDCIEDFQIQNMLQ